MPTRLILVAGGCRSGKSRFARQLAEEAGGERYFVATAPISDPEMEYRARRHRVEREAGGWKTLEEQIAVAAVIASLPPRATVLLDCLTLWVNNILFAGEGAERLPMEDDLAAAADALVLAARTREGLTVAVANEVGMGIVPENALARRFRDLAGRVNQVVAEAADQVYFMTCGIPTRIR